MMSSSRGIVPDEARRDHLRFLNAYYSKVHRIYDLTRKYFLFGRDPMLDVIVECDPEIVIEVGCGTGRNLARLKKRLPKARLGGVEPCASMRQYALKKYPWLEVSADVGEEVDLAELLSAKPDIVFFSYSMSMMEQPGAALANCLAALAPGGRIFVLDFGDLAGLNEAPRNLFMAWLRKFHVNPAQLDTVFAGAESTAHGPLRYWKRGSFRNARAGSY